MRICLADDEPLARERMRKMLSLADGIEICGEAQNGDDMIALIRNQEPDLVFIDIEMPKLDGFDVVEALAQTDFRTDPPLFIFATAFPGMAAQAFDTGAIDFLTKPIRPARLELALSRARQLLMSREAITRLETLQSHLDELRETRSRSGLNTPSIWVSSSGQSIRVEPSQIEYVSADAEYIRLHIGERSLLHRQSISAFEDEMADQGFVRVHRSFIVPARDCVQTSRTSWGGLQVHLRNGAVIPVGRKFKDKLGAILG